MRIIAEGMRPCSAYLVDYRAAKAAVAVIENGKLAGRHGLLLLLENNLDLIDPERRKLRTDFLETLRRWVAAEVMP